MCKYLTIYYQALKDYMDQTPRIGYSFSWFSTYYHSRTKYPALARLEKTLNEKHLDQQGSKDVILESLRQLKKNDYSFSLYLIDALLLAFPDEEDIWLEHHPKPLVFYTGMLYRGTLQAPEDALKNGIYSVNKKNVEEYAANTNRGVGISTSKDKLIAYKYKTTTLQTPKGARYLSGYIYVINYRGIGGIDIIETLKARKKSITACIASHKDEVNIIGQIKPSDIVAYYDKNNVHQPNPNYEQDRHVKSDVTKLVLPKRLQDLFQVTH